MFVRTPPPSLVHRVVETWLKRAQNRSTLCFAVNRAHAGWSDLHQKLKAKGEGKR